ncbi:hypothetical protein A2Z33_01890 [Candidatus Gottesmanbacteria bacterium RBG_16_52_11]|uniref:Uncharacterized protein n=1 Tax=Candidatus Gottesmanbacteria bacterium RBG_16_52_11 TaxID=1798374 RepID=A0A1F5YQQ5_9BACT|nr:MAG: hypothetical protein A2Z33_01890 [Candidatus Gottesmanbacteria bacterium RBG_16_52_11]
MPENEIYIGKNGCGVPESAISRPGTNNIFRGGSGLSRLAIRTSEDDIYIIDADTDGFFFEVSHIGDTIDFAATTKGWHSNPDSRHPDLYFSHLAEYAIIYFQKQGFTILAIRDFWDSQLEGLGFPGNINYHTFCAALAAISDPTDEDLQQAAATTVTGILAARLGYTEIIFNNIVFDAGHQPVSVKVEFRRPDASKNAPDI